MVAQSRRFVDYIGRGPFGVKGPALPANYDFNNPKQFARFSPSELRNKNLESLSEFSDDEGN